MLYNICFKPFNTLWYELSFSISRDWFKLIFQKTSFTHIRRHMLDNLSLGISNRKQMIVTCRIELKIKLVVAETAVEFNPKLDQ
jgi:hypothetical protein